MSLLKVPITDPALIQGLLPQRAPFIMVDRLTEFSEQEVCAGLEVREDNLLTQHGAFTAAGLIEHMAQTVALHTGFDFHLKQQPTPTGYIGAINDVVIHALPPVGAILSTTARLSMQFLQVTLVETEVRVDGTVIAACTMKTVIAEP
ncbi:MAG: hypothetical protein ABIQ75_00325 [Flavobacteriales bacterium]